MRKNTLSLAVVLAGLSLGLTTGCNEAPQPPPVTPTEETSTETHPSPPPPPAAAATRLVYTNPTSTDGWRLLADESSTPTRLVLDLVGPSGFKTRGVGFNLQGPTTVKFGAFDNGLPIRDTGVYRLRTHPEDVSEPMALVGGVKPGNLLTVGIYQKDRAWGARDSGVALCQIAIELDPNAQLKVGDALGLSITKAGAIPEDIGGVMDDQWTLDRKMKLENVPIQAGTLTAG